MRSYAKHGFLTMFELAIVGGGLAAWALADHLLQAGLRADQLLLLEQAMPASGASGALEAMLHPFTGRTLYPQGEALINWRYSKQWFAGWQAQSPQPLMQELELWRMAVDGDVAERLHKSYLRALAEIPDYPLREQANLPAPLQRVQQAYAFTGASRMAMPALVDLLAAQLPIKRQLHSGQVRLKGSAHAGWQLKTQQQEFRAQQVVLATGAGTPLYFPGLPFRLKRGEVALFDWEQQLPMAFSGGGRYLTPLGQGPSGRWRYILGATFYRGERPWAASQAWQDLKERTLWLKGLESAHLRQLWTATRCTLHPDREALVGAVPGCDRLWVMSAFSTKGLLQIPRAAWQLAQTLQTGKSGISPSISSERFEAGLWQPSDWIQPG